MGSACSAKQRPNFLIIMVDQERYPVFYETEEIRAWRRANLKAYEFLRSKGLEFHRHYAGSTACSPSRATIYTGQYPSLHGVSQTDGAAKSAYDPDMFWLDPHTVPTIGDYFRQAGYDTFWKGKWHASEADITIPGTHEAFLSYDSKTGVPIAQSVRLYEKADNLGPYGFSGWVGPEPHGSDPRNSGASAATGLSGRDVVYADEAVALIQFLEEQRQSGRDNPWLFVNSFVNPHDIAIFGAFTRALPNYAFRIEPSVPFIPAAPTAHESLRTKPSAQASYRAVYPKALQPLADTLFYRQLYYSLQLEVDRQINRVLKALQNSSFYPDTIIIFTSDHGELLGAHSLFQKWYQAYEESIHVPLVIHSPLLFPSPRSTQALTSHVDLLPTLLGLAGLSEIVLQRTLLKNHTEVRPLVGKDLTPLIHRNEHIPACQEPLYFMTDDNVTKGLNQVSAAGVPYRAVRQPSSVESVITLLPTGSGGQQELWKYSRYFQNPQFNEIPGRGEQFPNRGPVSITFSPGCLTADCGTVPDQFEAYNLTLDPTEQHNLAGTLSKGLRRILQRVLSEQRAKKRLYPTNLGG